MTVTYQVAGGGHLDIDFWVRKALLSLVFQLNCPAEQLNNPRGTKLYESLRKDTGTYSFTADIE